MVHGSMNAQSKIQNDIIFCLWIPVNRQPIVVIGFDHFLQNKDDQTDTFTIHPALYSLYTFFGE